MSNVIVVRISDEDNAKLQLISEYYRSDIAEILAGYVKWLVRGRIPHGYERAYGKRKVEKVTRA
jgi:hypothetical protein